jgi:hypothetical protein
MARLGFRKNKAAKGMTLQPLPRLIQRDVQTDCLPQVDRNPYAPPVETPPNWNEQKSIDRLEFLLRHGNPGVRQNAAKQLGKRIHTGLREFGPKAQREKYKAAHVLLNSDCKEAQEEIADLNILEKEVEDWRKHYRHRMNMGILKGALIAGVILPITFFVLNKIDILTTMVKSLPVPAAALILGSYAVSVLASSIRSSRDLERTLVSIHTEELLPKGR